ncbi:DciA family protein [Nannocystaceae bacterium ST9]
MSEAQRPKPTGKRVRRLGRVDVPDLVAAVLDRHVPPELQRLTRLREIWAELLPRSFTDAVWPMLVQGERLIVHVQDSQWLHEMTYWRQDVLARLREEWPESGIERLDAFVGELPPLALRRPPIPVLAPTPLRAPVLSPEVPDETMDALNQIRDPRLRDALAQARMRLGTRSTR